jgi:hypothetical protein
VRAADHVPGTLHTLHLDDHHLVLDTPDGPAIGIWSDLDVAVAFARTLVAADPRLRIILSSWPERARGHIAEHLHRQGWRLGTDWQPEVALTGSGRTQRARAVVEELAARGAEVPSRTAPIEGPAPLRRHHVWHDGDGACVEEVALDGQPLDRSDD